MEISAVCADEVFGNSESKTPKKDKEVKKYCFTFNNYDNSKIDEYKKSLFPLGKVIFSKEVGESGTPHLQGYINLIKKKSISGLVKCAGIHGMHFIPCKGSEEQNVEYCIKDGGECYSNFYEPEEPLRIISILRPWQLELEKLLVGPCDNDRLIHWYWEPVGNVGKSAFCKYLIHKYKAIYIDEGKKSDLMNIIFNVKVINSKSIVCIDIPRDNGNKCSYKSLESIKTGTICNTKYETGSRIFNSPHVVVFSNLPPEEERMSADKWHIVEIV